MSLIIGSTRILISILLMEVLSWFFVKFIPSWRVIKYLFLQRVFLIFTIVSILWWKPLLVFGLLLKVGLPPFHLWIIRLASELKLLPFIFIQTLHKLFPVLVFSKIFKEFLFSFMLRFFILFTGILVSNIRNILFVLRISSILHTFWILLGRIISLSLMLLYWAAYCSLLGLLLKTMNSNFLWLNLFNQRRLTSLVWLVSSGIPPFTIFWLKVCVIDFTLFSIRLTTRVFILLGRVLALTAYFRIWYFSMFHIKLNRRRSVILILASLRIATIF